MVGKRSMGQLEVNKGICMKYDEMNDWLFEIENYGTRLERFYEEVDHLTENNLRNYAILLTWLNAAFEAGKNGSRTETGGESETR